MNHSEDECYGEASCGNLMKRINYIKKRGIIHLPFLGKYCSIFLPYPDTYLHSNMSVIMFRAIEAVLFVTDENLWKLKWIMKMGDSLKNNYPLV